MLFSIGYQKMNDVQSLLNILMAHEVQVLVDVRSKPWGHNPQFHKKALSAALEAEGIEYLFRGHELGGFGTIEEAAISDLAEWQEDRTACLMCMEADPERCHRHHEIGRRLLAYGIEVKHLTID